MTKKQCYQLGRNHGHEAGAFCEVFEGEQKEAGCTHDPEFYCVECLTYAASEAELNRRDYSPFEFIAREINQSHDPDGLWEAYEQGVAVGIRQTIRNRLTFMNSVTVR
jgi:hypothetical protein